MSQSQEPRRGSIIGPLILITIGGLFLLANFGYITSSFWLILVQFWPLILILAGLEILLGRTRGGQLIVLLVGLLAVGGILWLLINPTAFPVGGSMNTTTIRELRTDIKTAELILDSSVGDLEIKPLDSLVQFSPEGAEEIPWIHGSVVHPNSMQLKKEYQVTEGAARMKLDAEGAMIFMGNATERWNIQLASQIPITLRVNAGIGHSKLDLNALHITQLDLDTGIGGMEVVLPSNAGLVTAKLDGGIGGLTVWIPQGIAARIRSHSGIGGATINQTRFPPVGKDVYESPDYATATNKIDLDVNAGIGGITIP